VLDGEGNWLVCWSEQQDDEDKDIFAQKVSLDGEILWAVNGLPVCTADGEQQSAQIVSDGSGGAILSWQDRRSGSHLDIYAQRIDADGTPQWTADGVPLCAAAGEQEYPKMVDAVTTKDIQQAAQEYLNDYALAVTTPR